MERTGAGWLLDKVFNVSCLKRDNIKKRENNHWGIWKSLLAKITEEDRISMDLSNISSQSLCCKSLGRFGQRETKILSKNFVWDQIKPSKSLIHDKKRTWHFPEVFFSSLIRWVNESPRCGTRFFPSGTSDYSLLSSQKHGQPLMDGWNKTWTWTMRAVEGPDMGGEDGWVAQTPKKAWAWLNVMCFFVFMCACKCEWKPAWPSETLINVACIAIRSFVFHVFVISPLVHRSQDISHWSKRARRDLFLCQQIIMLIKSCQKMKNHAKKSQSTVLTLVKTK